MRVYHPYLIGIAYLVYASIIVLLGSVTIVFIALFFGTLWYVVVVIPCLVASLVLSNRPLGYALALFTYGQDGQYFYSRAGIQGFLTDEYSPFVRERWEQYTRQQTEQEMKRSK